ncbi:MAG TPA: alpha-2-macroglobulin family protein [Pyrinomonadaceae bacterium]|nr:alpha-2-macroglobulin family protein [Pyrinomonadaceae bacterium]
MRGFFPETLLWQPELTTDKQGRAQLDFKLADNITTWKMAVIGSTEDGEIGTAETEIRAFQPFFAELDPPRVLTQGDRISLPVVLRNYLDRNQTVNLELKPESWFTIDGPNQTKTQIAAGDSAIKTFNFQAQSSIRDGKQRVTALGSEYSDAIEKPVSVHPWSLVFGL